MVNRTGFLRLFLRECNVWKQNLWTSEIGPHTLRRNLSKHIWTSEREIHQKGTLSLVAMTSGDKMDATVGDLMRAHAAVVTRVTSKDHEGGQQIDPNGETVDEVLNVHPSFLECSGCSESIRDRYFLRAMDRYWHEDCLTCELCQCRLGEVDCYMYTKMGRKLCKRDYLRLFAPSGVCSACNRSIPAYEMVMTVTPGRVFHLECFKCSQCEKHFCVGDKYYLMGTNIVCEDH